MISAADPRPPLDKERLRDAFELSPDLTLEIHDTAGSTNELAVARAREGAPDGLVVVADHQTAGRGRLDRAWETPPGTAVTFSLVLRPEIPPGRWPWLPLLAGHTVAKALAGWGYAARLKWPNDVLLGGQKVAGILAEAVTTPAGPAVVIGVGINVALTQDELPVPTATSLLLASNEGDPVPGRDDVLIRVVAALREGYDAWLVGGDAAAARLASSYAAHCATLGQQVRVELPGGGILTGTAVEVDDDGRLVVDTGLRREPVGVGDVVHVRANG